MSTHKIANLVKVDERAAFRNDVQLDNFDNPQLNLGLINSYLFSSALPGGRSMAQSSVIAPTGVLENLVQAFANSRLDNRFYLIATYGHGKSHLALALANYFSRAHDAPEVNILIKKLSNTLGSPAQAKRYDDFKRSRGEFLVLRLRGDVPHSLHEQVLQGLEKALGEHAATREQKMPFWFAEAERIIGGFGAAEKDKANRYLESAGYDIPLLLQRLGRREDVYDLCVKVIQHVSGIRPHLGGEVSLAHVVRWAADTFCGDGKPLGGLLILFDEFSLYVQRYAQRSAVGELQDLLNGVSDRQGKTAFLAFSQLDLMQMADNLHIAGETRIGLKRELTRIPKKWVLFSLMESVVDAYLIQDDKRWETFLTDKKMGGLLYQATDVAWERFNTRYSTNLRWSFEQFQEQVAKGCFPLHPITTYLLCNLRLQSDDAGTPRTVLGFVLEQLRARQDEPAANENRPNWILPIELVDYFEGRLTGDVYAQYVAARRTIGNDAPEEQQALLKAMLLQFLAEVVARRDEQIDFLAHAAGLEEKTAKQALRALSDNNVIRYDHSYKVYTFWSASTQPKVLEDFVQKKLERFSWSEETLTELNRTLATLPNSYFGSIDIKVDWGHATDWAAREYIITADLLTPGWLQSIALSYGYKQRDLIEGDRGAVVWVVANRDDEAASIREKTSVALQAAFADLSQNPPVIVAVVPMRAQPELLDAYRRRWALLQFSQKERADAGKEMYESETKQVEQALLRALKMIRADEKLPADIQRHRNAYMVPTAYIGELRTSEQVSLRDLFLRLYRAAFAYAPTEFFTQYRVAARGMNKLRDATRVTSQELILNATANLKALARRTSLVGDLCDMFLVQKWELLMPDYRIREQPGSRRIREAWQYLDNAIKPGNSENKLRDALFPLLNPPYGYDYNTALLLFAAWFGYHRLDLEVSVNGLRKPQQALIDLVEKGSREFFYSIAVSDIVSLQRRVMPNISEIKKRIQDAAQTSLAFETAMNEVVTLREIAGDERYNADLRDSAQHTANNLQQAIDVAREYDRAAAQIKEQVVRANTAQELITLQRKIAQLPHVGNVAAHEEAPAHLKERIDQRFADVIETICQENESPAQLTEVELKRMRLTSEKNAVAGVGLPALTQRIEASLARLAQREAELKQALQEEQRHQSLQAIIETVDPRGRLQQLFSGKATLQELADLPDQLAQQRDVRLQQVEKAIAEIRSQITRSQRLLENVSQLDELRTVRDKLVALQPRCADTHEATEIETLLLQADQTRARLEDQARRHAELKEIIRGVNDKAPLRQLIEGATQLRNLSDLPPDIVRLRDDRLKAVDKQIAAIHTQIEQAQSELGTARTVGQLDKLRTMLYELKSLCKDTAAVDNVEQMLEEFSVVYDRLTQKELRESEIRRVISAADPRASLRQLTEAQAQLSELTDMPDHLAAERDKRLQEIKQAIGAVRSQIKQARATLGTTQERQTVKAIRDRLLPLQARCTEMPEEGEVVQLIQQSDTLLAELDEQERRTNEWRARIRGVDVNHQRLRPLLDGRATLQSLPPLPDALIVERETRLREIEKAIAAIEQEVARTNAALDAAVTRRQLDQQRDALLALKQRCEDTPAETTLVQSIQRADALRRFFEQLESERKPQIDSPTGSHSQDVRLQQLMQEYAPYLSPQQQRLVSEKQEQLHKSVQEQREKAQHWIAEQAQAYKHNESLTEMDKRLATPPSMLAFLSPGERQPLETLHRQVRQQIDADALIAIENRFRQISERRLQEQCIQKLQQILNGETSQ